MKNVLLKFTAFAAYMLTGCTIETEHGLSDNPSLPSDGNDMVRREVLMTIKNKLSVVPLETDETKAAQNTRVSKADPIATDEENSIASLDVYIFGSPTEDGEYTFQERFAYRTDPADIPVGATILKLSTTGGLVNTSMRIRKGLFVKIYAVANNPVLVDPSGTVGTGTQVGTGDAKVVLASDFTALTLADPGTSGTDIQTSGQPTETEFKAFHTTLLDPATTTDIIATPLPMTGAYTTAYDLTDFSVITRLQMGIKLTRTVARFDIVNKATDSKFTIESISMGNGRRGVNCFPITPLGSTPALADELITYPARTDKFVGDKADAEANTGTVKGAFYSYPNLPEDQGYIILKGTYQANLTDTPLPVTYQVPFKQVAGNSVTSLAINTNHRYTIAITKADEYHVESSIEVADWSEGEDIDGFEPTEPGVVILSDTSFTMKVSRSQEIPAIRITGQCTGGDSISGPEWLHYNKAEAVATHAFDYTIMPNLEHVDFPDRLPEPQTITFFNRTDTSRKQEVKVNFEETIWCDISNWDAMEPEPDASSSYRVSTQGKRIEITAYSIFDEPTIQVEYDTRFGSGNNWLNSWSKTGEVIENNRKKYTYAFVIPASVGTDNAYQLHKGSITVKSTDASTGSHATDTLFTIWRGASNVPYPTNGYNNESGSPYYSAVKRTYNNQVYWWAPINCGASRVATNSTNRASNGNLYQWGRNVATFYGSTVSVQGPRGDTDKSEFICSDPISGDWASPRNNQLWSNERKTETDPCPTGWRVPCFWDVLSLNGNMTTSGDCLLLPGANNINLVFPTTGYRDKITGASAAQGTRGYYRVTTACLDLGHSISYAFMPNEALTPGVSTRGNAFSVRCIKDTLHTLSAPINFPTPTATNSDFEYTNDSLRIGRQGGSIIVARSSIKPVIYQLYEATYGSSGWLTTNTTFANGIYTTTIDVAANNATGQTAPYEVHIGEVTIVAGDRAQDQKMFTIFRGASMVTYLDETNYNRAYPHLAVIRANQTVRLAAVRKGGYWWAPVSLGANQVATNNTDPAHIGYLYQWGRKIPVELNNKHITAGPVRDKNTTDIFITSLGNGYNWLNVIDDYLWIDRNGQKTDRDPCPVGWRVPKKSELDSWVGSGSVTGNILTAAGENGLNFVWPASGSLYVTGAFQNANVYWSSTSSGGDGVPYIRFSSSKIEASANVRSFGLSIRCIKITN